jgi:hypothetical protein
VINVAGENRCEICGKPTRKVLLKDDQMKVYICSRKCEIEYLESLQGKDKALKAAIVYFDKKIAQIRRYELFCWLATLFGFVIIVSSIYLANIPGKKEQLVGALFFVGVTPLTGCLFLLSQLSKMKNDLQAKRKQLTLAYSV